jgi:hypothetical protein
MICPSGSEVCNFIDVLVDFGTASTKICTVEEKNYG